MSRRIGIIAAALMLFVQAKADPQELWPGKDGSIRNVDARAMFYSDNRMYMATRSELYVYGGNESKWESVFYIPSGENEINCAAGGSGALFIGTRRGLFRSQDQGRTWRNVFRTIIPEKSRVLRMDISGLDSGKVIIGTQAGLFASDDGGARWRNLSGALKDRRVRCIAVDKEAIYAGTDDGLYRAAAGSYVWERIIVRGNASEAEALTDGSSDYAESEEAPEPGIDCIALKENTIYVSDRGRILYSDDGKGWNDYSSAGLHGTINCILTSARSDKLYCGTSKGVFEYSPDKAAWKELCSGTDRVLNARSIVFGTEDEKTLWAGTDRGLYKFDIGIPVDNSFVDVEKSIRTMNLVANSEPTFGRLQAAAMRFNEVGPDKIALWRQQARIKALIPKVNVGFDNSKSNTYEIYTSATKDYFVSGPDDINEGVDVSVSWDLSALIWSDDQTNIDVRSRLTTQLRNDILDDLRRAYFERRRLQYEIVSSPPSDMKLRFEKELRIQELTQAIDDITGNYLSEHTQGAGDID